MAIVGFEEDIKPIFAPFAGCMANITVGTSEGVFQVDLLDYDRVKLLHEHILTAIRGHDPATATAHPMPPRGPLPDEHIQTFAQWIHDGMPRSRLVA